MTADSLAKSVGYFRQKKELFQNSEKVILSFAICISVRRMDAGDAVASSML